MYTGDYYFLGDVIFTKMSKQIIVNADITTKPIWPMGETITIGYIPNGWYPSINVYAPLIVYSFVRGIVWFTLDGKINVIPTEQIDTTSYVRFNLSYTV